MSQKNILVIVAILIVLGLLFIGFKNMPAGTDIPAEEEVATTSTTLLTEEAPVAGNGCDLACSNYVNKCLTLVPNANQELFEQGRVSCLGECQTWSTDKTDCIARAGDCPAMTEACGL